MNTTIRQTLNDEYNQERGKVLSAALFDTSMDTLLVGDELNAQIAIGLALVAESCFADLDDATRQEFFDEWVPMLAKLLKVPIPGAEKPGVQVRGTIQ